MDFLGLTQLQGSLYLSPCAFLRLNPLDQKHPETEQLCCLVAHLLYFPWLRNLFLILLKDEGDDEDDPEYNFLEDLDEPDTEDFRNDRAVRITSTFPAGCCCSCPRQFLAEPSVALSPWVWGT